MKHGAYPRQPRHGVHSVVVEEGAGVHRARGHDGHQLRDGQGLGLDQRLGGAEVGAKLGGEGAGVDLAEEVSQGLCLRHLPQVEQQPWPHDGGGSGGEQEPPVDGAHVLGAVEIGLVGGEDSEGAAEDGDGRHGAGAEGSQVDLSQGAPGVGDALVDEEGEAAEERDGAQGVDVECVAPPDLVRDGGPAQPPAQVAHGQGHEVGGGEGGGHQRRHRVREHRLDHGLGDRHDAHPWKSQIIASGQQIVRL